MKYDFETMISRAGTGSSKWNQMYSFNPDVPPDIVPFSVADMELKNPPEVVSGLQKYVGEVVMGYTNPGDSFFNAVKSWMKRRHNWDIEADWIAATPGVVAAFFMAVNAFAKKGEGVIVMTPVYYPFYMAIEYNERKIARNPLLYKDGDYTIDYDGLEALAKDPANKVLLFSSPHNPVGRVWTEEELRRVGDICNANGVLMLSDEIHNDLIMPGYHHTVYATLGEEYKNNCIVLTAPSKTFNLAGLQGSNIIIPNEEIREVYRRQVRNETSLTRLNMFAYKACEIAYNESEEWLNQLIVHIQANYDFLKAFMAEHLPKVDVVRLEGTYLVWMDFRSYGLDSKVLERIMQFEALLFLDEGYIFGPDGEGFERINIACPKDVLEAGLIRLRDAMKKYE